MRTLALVVVALTSILVTPPDADACSCGPVPPPIVSPANGATNVPVNAAVIASTQGSLLALDLREPGATTPIPLVLTRSRGAAPWLIGTPSTPLLPNTTYEVIVDTDNGPVPSTFTTGTETDLVPVAFAGLGSFAPETMKYPIAKQGGGVCINTCIETLESDYVSRIVLGYLEPLDAALLVLELYRADEPAFVTTIALPDALHELGYEACGVRSPLLDRDVDYCARLVAYDIAGNRSGEQATCNTAMRCAPTLDDTGCSPADGCQPEESGGCTTSPGPGTGLSILLALGTILFGSRRRR